jgi:hypothetical protein
MSQYKDHSEKLQSNFRNDSANTFQQHVLVVATAAGSPDFPALKSMLATLRKTSGHLHLIIFDLGLSVQQRINLAAADAHLEFWAPPPDECSPDCRPQMMHSLLSLMSVVVWADPGSLPHRDLRFLLTECPVGTALVAPLISGLSGDGGGSGGGDITTAWFAVFPDARLYNRVLLPWAACGSVPLGQDCPAQTAARRRLAALQPSPPSAAPADAHRRHSERVLRVLLDEFRRLFPAAVRFAGDFSPEAATDPPSRGGQGPAPQAPPRLLRISDALRLDRPVLGYVPLHGPNNQLSMVTDSAAIAHRLAVRFLAPPLAPHYARTDRPGAARGPAPPLLADALFSAHFLYRHAALAGPGSAWGALLRQGRAELVIFDRGDPDAPPALAAVNCTQEGHCLIGDLVGVGLPPSLPCATACSSPRKGLHPRPAADYSVPSHRLLSPALSHLQTCLHANDAFPSPFAPP